MCTKCNGLIIAQLITNIFNSTEVLLMLLNDGLRQMLVDIIKYLVQNVLKMMMNRFS